RRRCTRRERELTGALKGALKEEVESHDGELETLREQYSQDMENLRRTMEQVSQSQEQIEAERQRVNASMVLLGDELEVCREQGHAWKSRLETTAQALRDTRHELQKSQLEKEEFEAELRDLQDLKKQMPGRTHAELDQQKAEFDEKCEELRGLSAASKEREAGLRAEIDGLKDQSQSDKAELEKAKESLAGSSSRSAPEPESTQDLQEANTRLRERLSRLVDQLRSELMQERSARHDLEMDKSAIERQVLEAGGEQVPLQLGSVTLLTARQQVDQLRSELMQERSARHDLEMDKSAIERQMKDLKSRVADMETPSRPSAAIALLEKKLSLRVKALKRQVDESECEVERLEGVRRKCLRELEEQQEQREALQAKVTALEAELKRRVQHTRSLALSSVNLSSEDEDGFYDGGGLGGTHTESHLQNSNS
ncbi:hypothetical protein CRUP_014094, partial [Coryphaenoides rupestris]